MLALGVKAFAVKHGGLSRSFQHPRRKLWCACSLSALGTATGGLLATGRAVWVQKRRWWAMEDPSSPPLASVSARANTHASQMAS